ncbi:MAG: FHA domain-containing protein [Planctomycetota bacterium]
MGEGQTREMQAIFTVLSGLESGQSIVLRGGQTATVGRGAKADFSFPRDMLMSRLHFSITCLGNGCRLTDLGSSNGTKVNGELVTEKQLKQGDRISAGSTEFSVSLQALPPAGEPSERTTHRIVIPTGGPAASGGGESEETVAASPRLFESALRDSDPRVRIEALHAAAWTRQGWLLNACRSATARITPGSAEAARLLAILGEPDDLPLVLHVSHASALGPVRWNIVGSYGHPQLVETLLEAIMKGPPLEQVAAGRAFHKITGFDIQSDVRTVIPSAEGEDFADEEWLPNGELAREFWQRHNDDFQSGTRWCRGMDLSNGVTDEQFEGLDLESIQEARLRDHFHGRRPCRRADLSVFPLFG